MIPLLVWISSIIIIIDNFCIALFSGVPKLTARVCLILILPVVKFYESLTRGILITVIVCTKRRSFSRQVVSEEIDDAVPHNDESVVMFLLALPWWAPVHSYEYVLLSALTDVGNGMHANSSQIFLQFKMLIGTGQGGTLRAGGGQVGIVPQGNQTQPVRYKTLGLQIKLIWHCPDFHHVHKFLSS